MESGPTSYPIERSPFYRLRSPHKLAFYLGLNVESLRELCAAGDANYRQFQMDGRWIETPLPPLKAVQRKIHNFLCRIDPPDFLFSAYKGTSAVKNAQHHLHAASLPMIKLDVRRFYPSCQGRKIYDFFYNDLQCSSDVAGMFKSLCTIGATRCSTWNHLPTGGTTSSILSYLAYRSMFASILDVCKQHDLRLSVMADDITISGERAADVIELVKFHLKNHALHSNWKKQKVWPRNHNQKLITGAVLTPQGLRVPLKIKQNIAKLRSQFPATRIPKKRAKLYQRWIGSLASTGQIEPRFAEGAKKGAEEWKADAPAWQSYLAGCRQQIRNR